MSRESNLQRKCTQYLDQQKIYYINKYGDGRSGKGAPDLICCIDGRFVAFELKVGKNGLQDDQKIDRLRIQRNNGLHYTPYTFDEFLQALEEVKQCGISNIRRKDSHTLIQGKG